MPWLALLFALLLPLHAQAAEAPELEPPPWLERVAEPDAAPADPSHPVGRFRGRLRAAEILGYSGLAMTVLAPPALALSFWLSQRPDPTVGLETGLMLGGTLGVFIGPAMLLTGAFMAIPVSGHLYDVPTSPALAIASASLLGVGLTVFYGALFVPSEAGIAVSIIPWTVGATLGGLSVWSSVRRAHGHAGLGLRPTFVPTSTGALAPGLGLSGRF